MVLEIIKWCDLLELLAIMKVGGPHANSVTPASPRITHRALRIINFTFDQDCRPLFESLILPALTTLSLAYKAQSLGKTPFFMELIDLFSQSNCELQELSLSDSEFTKLALLECLGHKSCESLTSLRVTNMPWNHFAIMVDDELIMWLTYTEDQSEAPLCPKLSKLELETCYSEIISPGLLGEMVWSRRFSCIKEDRLESFTLITSHISEQDQTLLQEAEEDGLFFSSIVEGDNDSGDGDSA
jgi:hypothetical protein